MTRPVSPSISPQPLTNGNEAYRHVPEGMPPNAEKEARPHWRSGDLACKVWRLNDLAHKVKRIVPFQPNGVRTCTEPPHLWRRDSIDSLAL